jgi:glutamate dehydrogenase (NAD(P)+)
VEIRRSEATDGFIVFDLDGAPGAGVVRSAPKILVDGATALARSLTYRFASFERPIGGASAGVNAKPDERGGALAAFAAEAAELTAAGRLFLDPGKGVSDSDLAAVRGADSRPDAYWARTDELAAAGVVASAEAVLGSLDGRTVAIEGFDTIAGPETVRQLGARGARIVAVATAKSTVGNPAGLPADELAGGAPVADGGPPPGEVVSVDADVLLVGSKVGVLDHDAAASVAARVVVPAGPLPVTAKALAVLRRAEVVVLPDFVTTAGPMFAGWPLDGRSDPVAAATEAITAVLRETLGHADGPLLAACYRAEAYLATWRETLPFGRPLA